MTTLSKEIRQRARLSKSTYRLVINMEARPNEYWVETAGTNFKIDPNTEKDTEPQEEAKEGSTPRFRIDKFLMKERKQLPGNFKFKQVESINLQSPITENQAYIHYSPEGFVEASSVQIISNNEEIWTLLFNPLTGQAEVYDKAISLRDSR